MTPPAPTDAPPRMPAAPEFLRTQMQRARTYLRHRPFGRWLVRVRDSLRGGPPSPAAAPPGPRLQPPATARAARQIARPDDAHSAIRLRPEIDREAAHGTAVVPATRRHDVICLSIIDWEFRFQRPQQVMSQFAAHGHRVFYMSTSRFESPAPGAPMPVLPLRDSVFEFRARTRRPPNVYGDAPAGDLVEDLTMSLSDLRRTYDISEAIVYVMISAWAPVARAARERWGWPIVYDCMDEWENFPGISPGIVAAEEVLVRDCDLLVVTAQRLVEKWQARGRESLLVRNGVDVEFYRRECVPNDLLADAPHPIVGYFGAIADWFDTDLLAAVAAARPQYTFVLLGGVFDVDVRPLSALPNVRLLGQQPYPLMPRYLYHFDVCIIPFKRNPITQATDPVKLYEYLSGGKPVVSTGLKEVAIYREHVALADDASGFAAALDAAVADRDPARMSARREFAGAHGWAQRYESIETALIVATPCTSIVVVTFNNLALTRLCLESVLRNTTYPNYEVIVVDNASTDGTREYLTGLAAAASHVRVIFNETNEGFAAANNRGADVSRGDHIVLLNNDTVVPPGWLGRLARHLGDPRIGLVGPTTNFVGNEAFLQVPYETWGAMEDFAAARAAAFDGQVADISMLAMFCVALRRDVMASVGPLDEAFGLGMFEDDDYSQRIRRAGFRVVCAGDCFVHHVGQAAFKALIADGTYNPLFERNRKHYEEKWQTTWVAHVRQPLTFATHARSPQA